MYPTDALQDELWELSGWPRPYTLGYLLRKLSRSVEGSEEIVLEPSWDGKGWNARYPADRNIASRFGDTPEDATAKLAIELFKQGVLTKELEKIV